MPPAFLLRRFAMLLAMAVVFLSPSRAAATAGTVGQPIRLCLARATPDRQLGDLLARHVPLDCGTDQTRLGAGDFWVVSERFSRPGDVALRSASVWQASRTVYAIYGDGKILARTSDAHEASRSLQLGAFFLDHLPARGAPLVQIIWRVRQSANLRGIVVDPRLATVHENNQSNLWVATIFSAFAGMSIALLVHNFALWTAMRHRFQLAYCLLVTMLIAYAYSSSGALAWTFPWFDNNDRLRINYVGLGLAALAAVHFARTFFEARIFGDWLGRIGTAISWLVLVSCLAYALFAPWQIWYLDRAFALSFGLLVLYVPAFLASAWRRGSTFMWPFALAWTIPVLCAGLRIANNLNLISWNFWIDHSTILSMAAEALLSSVGVTYRIRLLSQERDDARVRELAAQALADSDPLTGLLNRRALLQRAIGRPDHQLLLVVDLDHFKAVNETIGHDGGDEVLRIFADMLQNAVPASALLARMGGEEFAIVAPTCEPVNPEDLLARLRRARMPYDLKISASIGACSGPIGDEADWKRLYACADRALYEAKSQGRDRAKFAQAIGIAA